MGEYSDGGIPTPVVALHTWRMTKAKRRGAAPNYFQQWRKAKDLTQSQVAERSGLSQGTIAKLEAGKIGFTQGNVEALAHAYGCEVADLFRPPHKTRNELADFVMSLDEKKRGRALRILKTHFEEDVA